MTARTVGEAVAAATAWLTGAGCETAKEDAAAIVAAAVDLGVEELASASDVLLSDDVLVRITDCVHRRGVHEPLGYILGRCDFRGVEVLVDKRVSLPLPDSEPLVELAIALSPGSRVHDVGTGSGAIALAVKAARPDLAVTASDISRSAVSIAEANARRLGLGVRVTEKAWLPAGEYDLVVAHLPHLDVDGTVMTLPPEILGHQPPSAIYSAGGPPDGLATISEFLLSTPSGTRVAVQHAASQTSTIRSWLYDAQVLAPTGRYDRVTVGWVR